MPAENVSGILVNSGSKINFKVKYDISPNEASLIFYAILPGQCISEISLIIQGHLQGQRSISGLRKRKYHF